MRKSKVDPRILDHLEWLGFVKPTGLVVSAPALVRAGAILNRRDAEGQCALRELIEDSQPRTPDFVSFARKVLGWSFSPNGYAGTDENPIPDDLVVPIGEGGQVTEPSFAVRELEPKEGAKPWQLLVQVLEPGTELDKVVESKNAVELSAQGRMERLLRKTGVSAGLVFNGRTVRLVSAPYGESSGWLDFQIADMAETAGRPICSALRMLLSQERLLALPKAKRLTALLDDSRKFQNEVSERLAEQVLEALYEFLRGFQAAHDSSRGELLKEVLEGDPDLVYRAVLTVILRLVFLLYAEERDMLPQDETFLRYYSLAGLHERLREDAALNPDTMDQRFGAWAQLVVLFRMVYDGATYGDVHLPKRHGDLFDPERFRFLEGRKGPRQPGERFEVPLIPDGTVYRVLEKLLVLDGERLSYRALDVEQIGSVYETMMGFQIDTATGKSIAIRAEKRHGAPTTIDLEALLAESGTKRETWLQNHAGRKLSDAVKQAVKDAGTLEGLHAALQKVVDLRATPDVVPTGSLILQPSEARRKSGSHYTPRSLTEPIVRTTLEPLLARLRESAPKVQCPTPAAILDLKVCDPAMGSGAFLVETCRQLADVLVESWHTHGGVPTIPPDEDEVIYARRLIAQRCLYGVDKNPMAVDLAKVSLWLVTLAKDHAFTFLDHALRNGDSLVGLDRKQVDRLHWDTSGQASFTDRDLPKKIEEARRLRLEIASGQEEDHDRLIAKLTKAESILRDLRLVASAVVAAYFLGTDRKSREVSRTQVVEWVRSLISKGEHRTELELYSGKLLEGSLPLPPFHWEFEFPEVFLRSNGGFDAIVGNPPFAGKNTLASGNRDGYPTWLQEIHLESHGNADLVAHFFRRGFELLRKDGALGLIATNTIGQGDTRSTGLRMICNAGGQIYTARRRVKWPGLAAVIVSVVHIYKGRFNGQRILDGHEIEMITAFLFHRGGNDDPKRLVGNAGKSFVGSYVLGMGLTFDDSDRSGLANPISDMHRLLAKDPRNSEVIFPYIGGEEVNTSPTHAHSRYVINFGDRPERECWQRWPDLMAIVENKTKGTRASHSTAPWWQFERLRGEMFAAIDGLERVLFHGFTCQYLGFAFLPNGMVYGCPHIVLAIPSFTGLAILQSRTHECWARFFGSSMKDDLRYTPSDCFETFPFPPSWQNNQKLEAVGKQYYEYRADLMVGNNEGLTKTYNRFHNPEEASPDILKLRELHAAMDRAVLDAYGWTDIPTHCEFILDYEDEDEDANIRRKKPWRYRWPDEVRDEVLARLLELNAQRAKEEQLSGLTGKSKTRPSKRNTPKEDHENMELDL